MTDSTEIRRHANGSIDIPHYLARGRQARSDEAWRLAAALRAATGRLAARLRAGLTVWTGPRTQAGTEPATRRPIAPQRAGRLPATPANRARRAAERTKSQIVS